MHIRICCSTGDLALLGDLGENPSGLVVLDVQHLARGSGTIVNTSSAWSVSSTLVRFLLLRKCMAGWVGPFPTLINHETLLCCSRNG